jgi:hypothetical protein
MAGDKPFSGLTFQVTSRLFIRLCPGERTSRVWGSPGATDGKGPPALTTTRTACRENRDPRGPREQGPRNFGYRNPFVRRPISDSAEAVTLNLPIM